MRHVRPANAGTAVVSLCALVCALAWMAACTGEIEQGPDTAGGDVDVSAGMLEAMERDLGLTEDQARERMRLEGAAAQVEPAVRDTLGDRFGGAWMSADGTGLVVAITDMADADAVRDSGAEPVLVTHSLAELTSIKQRLDDEVARAGDDIHAWYVDVATNEVVVRAADPSSPAVAAFVGDADLPVRVIASDERPRPLYDVRGGDEFILGGTVLCSVGFAVHGGFVTAGHCGRVGTQTYGSNWVAQGTVQGSTFPVHDYAWIQTNGSWSTLPSVTDHRGGAVPVAGSTVASVGSSICRSGRTTGWRCGVVQARDVTINYAAGPVYNATQTNACAEGGDSGGAFLSGNQAQGVTSGGSGNCSSGGNTFFQPVNPILAVYGLGLKTSGGGGGGQEIVSHYNGKCIDVPSSNFSDGVKLQMWDCNNTAAQRWTFTGGTVRAGGLCMDVAWGSTANGAEIQIVGCSGHLAQQFSLNGAGELRSNLSGKCVDIAGWNANSGARLIQWTCGNQANQHWTVR